MADLKTRFPFLKETGIEGIFLGQMLKGGTPINKFYIVRKKDGATEVYDVEYFHSDGRWRETTSSFDTKNTQDVWTGIFETIDSAKEAIDKIR
jgi:hypothetical protein